MKIKVWEVILWKEDGTASFKQEHVNETTEQRAREEARKRFCFDGWSIYNVHEVRTRKVS